MTKDTMVDAFDRREANRDAASWVKREFERQSEQLEAIRSDICVNTQHLEHKLEVVTDKVEALSETCLSSIPNRDPKGHLHHHEVLAKDLHARDAEEEENTKFRRDLRYKAKMAIIALGAGCLALGVVDYARNFVLGVEQGKSSMELRKAEPVTTPVPNAVHIGKFNR